MPPIPPFHDPNNKRGEQARLQSEVVEIPFEERLKCPPIREHLQFVFLKIQFEIFHVSDWSEQIANAMINNMLVYFFSIVVLLIIINLH